MTSLSYLKEKKKKDKELIEIAEEIHEIKSIVRKKENNSEALEKQRVQIQDLRTKFEEFTRNSFMRLEESQEVTKDWSSLFKDKVEMSDVQISVVETKISFEHESERMAKKNNIVAYNVPENESNSKYKHKETLLKLFKEITNMDMEREII